VHVFDQKQNIKAAREQSLHYENAFAQRDNGGSLWRIDSDLCLQVRAAAVVQQAIQSDCRRPMCRLYRSHGNRRRIRRKFTENFVSCVVRYTANMDYLIKKF